MARSIDALFSHASSPPAHDAAEPDAAEPDAAEPDAGDLAAGLDGMASLEADGIVEEPMELPSAGPAEVTDLDALLRDSEQEGLPSPHDSATGAQDDGPVWIEESPTLETTDAGLGVPSTEPPLDASNLGDDEVFTWREEGALSPPDHGTVSATDEEQALEATPLTSPDHREVDSHELDQAVMAYLGGDDGASGRVAAAAAPLLEQFALDPLADAAERLVVAAGDPPDVEVLNTARAVLNPAVASKLVQRMGAEPDPEKRGAYIVICQRFGEIMAKALRGALTDATDRSARRAYYDALIAMGRSSRPIIEGMVEDDNRFLVRNAVAILGEIGGDRAVDLVTSALANTDPRVRKEALRALAKLGDPESGHLVLGFLEDPDAGVRIAAATAAGELGVERALRPILALLEDEQDPDVSLPLLGALGRLADPGAVPRIEKIAVPSLFSRPRADVRIAAYRALHSIGTPHARDLLKKAVTDKDLEVRDAVRSLLRPG